MDIRFVSQDMLWTETMKECVLQRIVGPLQRHLGHSDFELSVHVNTVRRSTAPSQRMEMWVVLQSFDGRGNEIVRHCATEFHSLTNETSSRIRARLKQSASPRSWNFWASRLKSSPSPTLSPFV